MKNTEHTVHIIETIDAPIEKVWKLVRNFNGLSTFHPAVKESRIESGDGETVGSIRHLTLDDGYVREKLLLLDDSAHALDYSIIEGTIPVENYKAGMRLKVDSTKKHTICEWWADFDPVRTAERDALIENIGQNVFKLGFQSIVEWLKNN